MARRADGTAAPDSSTRPSRFIRLLMVAVLATVGLTIGVAGVVPVGVVHACRCMDPATRLVELQSTSDAAFVGTVVEIRRPTVPRPPL